ncbi:STM3941 family protein [uncultured Clostridium sp.]|jgi:hypothetical protein|uniref:STM3941 family protein n=1 Tax=uncultured Clostridium sp. TaxID=59620 RepID=UPI002618EE6D|nr:STM3941 family protein [uncultured Clostridium sp.]
MKNIDNICTKGGIVMADIRVYKEADEFKKMCMISVGIIVLFSWFIYKEFRFITVDYRSADLLVNMAIIFIAGITIMFLFIFLIKLTNKILNNDPFLVFEDDEILSKGLAGNTIVKWNCIKSYKEKKFRGTLSIVLELKDDCDYKRNLSIMRSLLYKYNQKRTGGEFMFTKTFLGDQYNEILNLVEEKVKKN